MELKQHLSLFKEVKEALKENPESEFVCHISEEFENLWYDNNKFKNLLWDEVLLWEGCDAYTKRELSRSDRNLLSCLMYCAESERTSKRIEFFTHLINKLENA